MKQCAKCGVEHDHKHSYCKPCLSSYQREWRQKNPESQRAYKKKWEAEHPEEVRAAKRRRYQSDLERARGYRRKRMVENPEGYARNAATQRDRVRSLGGSGYYKYGITIEQRAEFMAKQGGKCPLCNRNLSEVRVHVDHDHETGLIRGLLCPSCNHRLGWYEKRTEAVAQYLGGPHVPGAAPIARGVGGRRKTT